MAAFNNWLGQLFDDGHLHANEAQLSQWQKIHHPFLSEDDLGTDLGKKQAKIRVKSSTKDKPAQH